jgi:hypothetical protein
VLSKVAGLLSISQADVKRRDLHSFSIQKECLTLSLMYAFLPHSNGWLIQLLRIDKAASQSAKVSPSYRGFFLASTSTN